MGVRLTDFQRALHALVPELPPHEWAARPESLTQQLLHHELTSGRPRPELLAVVSARLRQITGAVGRTGLATRWSTSRSRRRLRTPSGPVALIAASADGAQVLFAGRDDVLWQWSPATADPPRRLGRCGYQIYALALSRDGRTAVTGDAGGAVCRWSPGEKDPAPIQLGAHRGFCRGVALSEDGSLVVSVGDEGRVLRWSADGNGTRDAVLGTLADELLTAVAVLGGHVATGDRRGQVHRLDLDPADGAQEPPTLLGAHDSAGPVTLAVAPRRGLVVSLGRDNRVLSWSLERGSTGSRPVGGYHLPLWGLAVSADEAYVVSGGADCLVMAWPMEGGDSRVIQRHERSVSALAAAGPPGEAKGDASPVGSVVFSGGNDGLILRWEGGQRDDPVTTRAPDTWAIAATPLPASPALASSSVPASPASPASLPDGARRIVTGGRGGMTLWELTDAARPPERLLALGQAANALALLGPYGPLVWVTEGRDLMLAPELSVSAAQPPETVALSTGRLYDAVCALPDGEHFLATGRGGQVELWHAGTRQMRTLGHHRKTRVRAVAVNPEGTWAVTTGHDRTVRRWDLTGESGQELLGTLTGRGRSLTFSHDGHAVYAGDDEGHVVRWFPGAGPAPGQVVGRHRPGAVVRSVAVLPGSGVVASTADGGSVRLWRAAAADGPEPLTRLAMTNTPLRLLTLPGGLLVTDYAGGLTFLDVLGPTLPAPQPPPRAATPTEAPPSETPDDESAAVTRVRRRRMVIADQWWLRHQAPRPDLGLLLETLMSHGPVEPLLCCPDIPALLGFRQAMLASGWTLETVPPDRPSQRRAITELVERTAAYGPVLLISGDEILWAALTETGTPVERLTELPPYSGL
ncbi:WD40 repeat domain-containing protein [Streptomyces sp. JJ38]|uniref:WD40 repeat domain-containing protein n=1 Tax=Streptomyces sp. JJ38 TaxID=2738128 RepID=UPI001C575AC8|nr:hypothetical protein [Streptomyces sp. JJ38]MBW1596190.1 hypothetical protein [Streptomyces sp. JJ38]